MVFWLKKLLSPKRKPRPKLDTPSWLQASTEHSLSTLGQQAQFTPYLLLWDAQGQQQQHECLGLSNAHSVNNGYRHLYEQRKAIQHYALIWPGILPNQAGQPCIYFELGAQNAKQAYLYVMPYAEESPNHYIATKAPLAIEHTDNPLHKLKHIDMSQYAEDDDEKFSPLFCLFSLVGVLAIQSCESDEPTHFAQANQALHDQLNHYMKSENPLTRSISYLTLSAFVDNRQVDLLPNDNPSPEQLNAALDKGLEHLALEVKQGNIEAGRSAEFSKDLYNLADHIIRQVDQPKTEQASALLAKLAEVQPSA